MNPVTVGAVLLVATALAKALGASMEHVLLGQPLRELGAVTYRQALIGTAVIELAVGTFLLSSRRSDGQGRILTALVASFWAYRIAALAAGIEGPCPCLGNMWHWASLSAEAVNWLGWGVLCALTICAAMSIRRADPTTLASACACPADEAAPSAPKAK